MFQDVKPNLINKIRNAIAVIALIVTHTFIWVVTAFFWFALQCTKTYNVNKSYSACNKTRWCVAKRKGGFWVGRRHIHCPQFIWTVFCAFSCSYNHTISNKCS